MLADLWDVIVIVAMILAWLVPVIATLSIILWAWERGQQLVIWVLQAWEDLKRQRLDNQLVIVQPGVLKVPRNELADIVRQQIQLALVHVEANRLPANVPHTLHYAPHIRQIAAPQMEQAVVQPPPLVVPSFSELFRSGIIRPDRLLLGYHEETGQPHYSEMRDVYSSLIIAKSGGGKTTLERFLVAQACMMGAKIAIVDPHGRARQGLVEALRPLAAHQIFEPAIDDKPIEDAIHYFLRLVENRINKVDTTEHPCILAVDEVNMLIDDLGKGFAADLTQLAERGRKVGVFVFAAGQSAEMSRTGGDARLRKAFVGRYVLRADKDAVQRLIPDRDMLNMVPLLTPGHAIFVPTASEPVPLAIPDTTEVDLRTCFPPQVVEPLRKPLLAPLREPLRNDPSMPDFVVADDILGSGKAHSAIELFKAGATTKEVLQKVWEVTASGGDKYAKAAQEWQSIQRAYMVKSGM